MTETLLVFGAACAVTFLLVITVAGARRPGYVATYHTGSELELGRGGWIQRANFVLVAAGFLAVAVGVERSLDATGGAVLIGVAGVSLLLAGVFAPDPVRGFPLDAPSRPGRPSLHHRLHDATGPVMAAALFGGCLAVSASLQGPWAMYTVGTAAAGLVMTGWLILAYRRDAARTGLVQRIFLGIYWLWVVLLCLHLLTR